MNDTPLRKPWLRHPGWLALLAVTIIVGVVMRRELIQLQALHESDQAEEQMIRDIENRGCWVPIDSKYSKTNSKVVSIHCTSNQQGISDLGRKYNDDTVAYIGKVTTLRVLILDRLHISNDALSMLGGLSRLKSLSLRRTPISDAGLVHLSDFSTLRNLDLSGTKISDAGLVHLSGLTNLTFLYLADTEVGDARLAHLAGLVNLVLLDLTHTRVTDAGMTHLGKMRELSSLNLTDTTVGGAGLVHLTSLTKLDHVWLLSQDDRKDIAELEAFREAMPNCELTFLRRNPRGDW